MKKVLKEGNGEAHLNKSRFHSLLLPLSGPEELEEALSRLKKDYPKADHYPYAYRLGERGKSTDDGEPGSTAGRPLLTLLESEDIDGAFLGVARYFGGIKLGVGPLRRCFVDAGQAAIADAVLGKEEPRLRYFGEASYSEYQELERLAPRLGFEILSRDFAEKVRVRLQSAHPLEGAFEEKGLRHLLREKMETTIVVEEKRK